MKKQTIRSQKISIKPLSQAEIKKAFSTKATQKAIEACKQMITDPQMREQSIAFIKAVDGKKIRNKSGV